MVIRPYKCTDCQQLVEWVTTEFKGTVHIPTFGMTQDIELFGSGRVGDAEHVPNTNTSI